MSAAPVADAAWAATSAGTASSSPVTAVSPRPVVGVVVPSNRPDSLARWRSQWTPHLVGHKLYVVEDAEPTWQAIRDDLGDDAWIIPRQSDCIRMYGYLQALRDGCDIIVTMDDDCYPDTPTDAIAEHVRALTTPPDAPGWGRTLPDVRTRGIPTEGRVVVNHGLWTHVPDLDGALQLAAPPLPRHTRYPLEQFLTPSLHYPLSGMNLAWWAEWTPVLYFGLMGHHMVTGAHWGVDRFGDIWAGLAAKRVADHRRATIRSGTPWIYHARASDPVVNEQRERAGVALTPWVARRMFDALLGPRMTLAEAAHTLAEAVRHPHPYWTHYADAWHRWIALTTKELV